MLSWRLWRSLNQPPPKHPLRRFVRAEAPPHKNRNCLLIVIVAFFVLPGICVFCTIILETTRHSPVMVAALPFGLSILFNGLVLRWTLGISTVIGLLRARGLSEMVGIIPLGAAGSGWLIGKTWMQQENRFRRLKSNVRALALFVGVLLILTVLTVFDHDRRIAEPARSRLMTDDLAFTVDVFGLVALLYVDFMQTCVFAAIAGIVDTVNELHRVDARAASVTLFVAFEALLYLVMILITLVALPNLYAALGINAIVAALFTLATQFALLIGGRELVIRALWRQLSLAGGDPLMVETTT